MIQKEGKILVKEKKNLEPILDALSDAGKGVDHLRNNDVPLYLSWSSMSTYPNWQDGEEAYCLYGGCDYLLHTLSDFGLGNELPAPLTMEDIKVKSKYLLRDDLEHGKEYGGRAYDSRMDDLLGQVVTIMGKTKVSIRLHEHPNLVSPEMLERIAEKSLTIGSNGACATITLPKDKTAPTYQFGDKVKVGKRPEPRYFFSENDTHVCVLERDPKTQRIKHNQLEVKAYLHKSVSPWPEPETVKLNAEYEATVYPEHIKVGCQEISFEAFSNLAAAVAKAKGE